MSYVYIMMDPKTKSYSKGGFNLPHEPIYVGKGSGNRANDLRRKARNKLVNNRLDKIGNPVVMKIGDFLEDDAFRMEQSLIETFGRKIKGEGPLLNFSDGGKGGRTGFKHSEETKQKIRLAHLGTKHPWTSEWNTKTKKGKSTGTCWNKGIPVRDEVKAKVSKKLQGRIPWNKGLTKETDNRMKGAVR